MNVEWKLPWVGGEHLPPGADGGPLLGSRQRSVKASTSGAAAAERSSSPLWLMQTDFFYCC